MRVLARLEAWVGCSDLQRSPLGSCSRRRRMRFPCAFLLVAVAAGCFGDTDTRTLLGVHPSQPIKFLAGAGNPSAPQVLRLMMERDAEHSVSCVELAFEMGCGISSDDQYSYLVSSWTRVVAGSDTENHLMPPVFSDVPDNVELIQAGSAFEKGGDISTDCSFGGRAWVDLKLIVEPNGPPSGTEISWGASETLLLSSDEHSDRQRLSVFQWSGSEWKELSVTRIKRGPSAPFPSPMPAAQ